jgi:hypothetical protein
LMPHEICTRRNPPSRGIGGLRRGGYFGLIQI